MRAEAIREKGLGLLRRLIVIHALLATWYLIAVCAMPDSVLRTSWMPMTMRLSLVLENCIWLLVPALLIALPQRRWLRWVLGSGVVFLFLGSWGEYETTGAFATLDALRFFFTVPKQSLEHAQLFYQTGWQRFLVLICGGVILLAANEYARRLKSRTRRGMVALATAGMLLVVLIQWRSAAAMEAWKIEIDDTNTGVSYQSATLMQDVRRHASGPTTTLLLSLLDMLPTRTAPFQQTPWTHVVYPVRDTTAAPHAAPKHRWNVLVIVVESMREDALFGEQPVLVMPAARAIADHAFRFTHTYTTATQTNLAAPVPLSSQYPLRMKEIGPYPTDITWPRVMLHDLLKPLGWRTAVFSSQNEAWWGMKRMLETPALDTLFDSESYQGETYLPKGDIGFARFVRKSKKAGKLDDYDTASEALLWLGQHRDQPFMLAMNFQNSHLPYGTPEGAPRRFGVAPPNFPILFGRFPEESLTTVINEYHNSLSYVDAQIARLQAALVRDGRWDSTIVVITGDHGQAFFEHGVAAHANGLWEEQVDVPLVIAVPGRRGGDDPRPATHLDVVPSIADALGLPQAAAWQGVSLFGPAPREDRLRFFMVQTPLAHEIGVVSSPWKLVMDMELGTARLTNLADDPGERHDVSLQRPEITKWLSGVLTTWQHEQLTYYGSMMEQLESYPPRITADPMPEKR